MPKRRRNEEEDEDEEEEEQDEDEDDRPRRRKRRGGGAVSHVVPYTNPMALAGYYCGFGSLLPVLGCLLGPLAIILGIMGMMKVRKNPEAHGTAHAITGILLGLVGGIVMSIVWGGLFWIMFKTK
jgi:uncharacterized protein YqgC (DUF456 family)